MVNHSFFGWYFQNNIEISRDQKPNLLSRCAGMPVEHGKRDPGDGLKLPHFEYRYTEDEQPDQSQKLNYQLKFDVVESKIIIKIVKKD